MTAVDAYVEWLHVNKTFGRRPSRFRLRADGSLGPRDVATTFGQDTFPDGLTLDEAAPGSRGPCRTGSCP